MIDNIGTILIIVGLGFDLIGCVGLFRFQDVYNKLQATVKCVMLGTCFILLGIFIIKGISAAGVKALIAAGLLIITVPIGAHSLARAVYKSKAEEDES